jgi:kynurenine formamidase
MTQPIPQNKLNLYKPKSKLAYAEQMSAELLSEVTIQQEQDYLVEFENMKAKKASDIEMAQQEMSSVKAGLDFLFGEGSKEVKYIDKALLKGNTIVDKHYGQIMSPNNASDLIEDAKTKVGITTSVKGLDETDINALNDSIQHLTANGYVFGRDFTTHNAIDIAQASFFENLVTMGAVDTEARNTMFKNLLGTLKKCKGCDTQPYRLQADSISVACECYEDSAVIVSFGNESPELKYDKVTQ